MRLQYKNLSSLFLSVFLILKCCLTIADQQHLQWEARQSIKFKALKEKRSFRVLLPESYPNSDTKQYPLLVLLDGQNYGDLVATNAKFLASVGEIPEHIIVAIDSVNRMRDYTPSDSPHWIGGGGGKQFLTFVQNEFIPVVEKKYRIQGEIRIIWGHSLSGLFAMYALYAAPNLFDAHLVIDGALGWDDKLSEKLLKEFIERNKAPKSFLYFNSSYQRPVSNPSLNVFDTMNSMLKQSAPKNIRWVYDSMQGESHTSIPMLGSIRGLKTLYDGYRVPEELMFEGLDVVTEHYRKIKDRIGAPTKIPEYVLLEMGGHMFGESITEAKAVFELATQLYPYSASAWSSLSDVYLEMGSKEAAINAIKKAIKFATEEGHENLDYFNEKYSQILHGE